MSKSYTVFILRGQPVHTAHLDIIRRGLEESDEAIAVIGSYRSPITIKNPWTYNERVQFIRESLTVEQGKRVKIKDLRDFLYSDTTWVTSLQNTIASMVEKDATVNLIGHFKDDSSYYLNYFPQWKLIEQKAIYCGKLRIDGTEIRRSMFEGTAAWQPMVSPQVREQLLDFMKTELFERLKREYRYIQDYKKMWEVAPFPPTFVTTDAVVVQAGHILLIKRKVEPGKGCFALPGGFLNQDETIEDCTIRELKEETRIDVPAIILEKSVKEVKVFGHPRRSLRGRSITHATLYVLDPGKPLPNVRGDDDADNAFWMPINDLSLHEENFFEDHMAMIQYFVHKL